MHLNDWVQQHPHPENGAEMDFPVKLTKYLNSSNSTNYEAHYCQILKASPELSKKQKKPLLTVAGILYIINSSNILV